MSLDFSDIAPYRDDEVKAAIRALLEELSFIKVLRFVYPDMSDAEINTLCKEIDTVAKFQATVAYPAMKLMGQRTIQELSSEGFDDIVPGVGYLYISNHRDIILDSALLNMHLHEHGLETTETAIGSNLLKDPTVRHLTKLNKNFTVHRDLNRRELYEASMKLSSYIREAVTERHISIWISQREGRAKDGNDSTQQGLVKMLTLSGEDVKASLKALRIRPLALSYEYDPCDVFKLRELVKTQRGETHEKGPDEDLLNIVAGISQPKGRVHLAIGPVLDKELDALDTEIPVNDQIMQVAEIIDAHIYAQARLWPNNYIAADLVSGQSKYKGKYTEEDQSKFHEHLEAILSEIQSADRAEAKAILLQKYAYPTINKASVLASSK